MRHFTIATLALTAAALTTTIANAAGFAGNVSVAGPTRNVVVMNQATPLASILATPVRVYMCTGVVEMPVFVATSAVSAQAVGTTYVIEATLVDPTTTRFKMWHTGATTASISAVDFGGGAQRLAFDRTNPNPGSAGSAAGRDVAYIAGAGTWIASAVWSTPIKVGAVNAQNDAYNKLTIKFTTCFTVNNYIYFNVDTDYVN
jgi:hypothetical protein